MDMGGDNGGDFGNGKLVRVDNLPPTVGRATFGSGVHGATAFEMRVPGAAYGPVREQRGGSGSRVVQSAALLEGLSRLAKQRSGHMRDPAWLSEEGRAELLFGDYKNAVDNLERAHQLSPMDDYVEIDFASALSQRSSTPGLEDDLPRALDLLREVTARNPQNSLAWFNLALVSERMQALTEALEAWDTYLKLDSSSGWAVEARERRDALQKRLKELQAKKQLAGRSSKCYSGALPPRCDCRNRGYRAEV